MQVICIDEFSWIGKMPITKGKMYEVFDTKRKGIAIYYNIITDNNKSVWYDSKFFNEIL